MACAIIAKSKEEPGRVMGTGATLSTLIDVVPEVKLVVSGLENSKGESIKQRLQTT